MVKISLKKIILLLFTLLLLYFVFVNLDFNELLNQFKNIDYKYLFLLAVSIVVSLFFRGLCFKQIIYKTVNIPSIEAAALCITSSALNIVLPARAGDIFRAYFVGDKYNADKVKIFGAVMFERILDMIVICMFLLFGILVYHRNPLAIKLCLAAFFILLASLIFAVLTYKFKQIDKICGLIKKLISKIHNSDLSEKIINFVNKMCNSFCSGFEIIDSPKRLSFAILTSVLVWIFDCLNYVIILMAFNCPVHWSVAIFISCFIVFACLIPSASIFVGPYQIAIIAAYAMYNVGKESALAIAFVEQAVVIITTISIAITFFFINNISLSKFKEEIK